jgi:bacterioferritin
MFSKESPMKGNDKLIEALNSLLARELTAINQYMVEAEEQDNWGYEKLHADEEKRAMTEMKHAEKLIGRIIFLEGQPVVSKLEDIHIGQDVPQIVTNDLTLEYDAVKRYNDAIKLAGEVADNSTRDLLKDILNDEIEHVNELEAKRDQISQMGVQNFLTTVTQK